MEGRQLLGLKITAGVRGERPLLRPQVKFSASLHGDEAVSRELLIGLARSAPGGLSVDNNREYEIALILVLQKVPSKYDPEVVITEKAPTRS